MGLLLLAGGTLALTPGVAVAAPGDQPAAKAANHKEPPGQAKKVADAPANSGTDNDSPDAPAAPAGQASQSTQSTHSTQSTQSTQPSGSNAAAERPASATAEPAPAAPADHVPPGAAKKSATSAASPPSAHTSAAGSSAVTASDAPATESRTKSETKRTAKSHEPAKNGHSTQGGSTGPLDKPQPPSHADENPGGANGQCPGGPYCSTRDGSASGNGNGNGKATGKPCAGCVGKADNKNPKGQLPGGNDHNNGYECDGNHGIGRTNPAHTGCKVPPPPACVPSPANYNCKPVPPACVPSPANYNCKPVPPACVPSPANNNCQPVPPACVPSPANNNCQPVPPACVPSAANNNCQPVPPACVPSAANNNCLPVPLAPTCVPTPANLNCTTPPPPSCVPADNENEDCVAVEGRKVGSAPGARERPADNQPRVLPAATGAAAPAATLPHTGAGGLASMVAAGCFFLIAGAVVLAADRRKKARA